MKTRFGKRCVYSGVRFVSQLEARHALFMSLIGVRWCYEPSKARFTFLGGLEYMPDFFLEGQRVFLEVKGENERSAWLDRAMDKAAALATFSGHSVFVSVNAIPRPDMNVQERWSMLHFPPNSGDAFMAAWSVCLCCSRHFLYSSHSPACPHCGRGHGDEVWQADPLCWRADLDSAYRTCNMGWQNLKVYLKESA